VHSYLTFGDLIGNLIFHVGKSVKERFCKKNKKQKNRLSRVTGKLDKFKLVVLCTEETSEE